MLEVMEEEELENLREQQRKFQVTSQNYALISWMSIKVVTEFWNLFQETRKREQCATQRLEEQELRLTQERERRIAQQREVNITHCYFFQLIICE